MSAKRPVADAIKTKTIRKTRRTKGTRIRKAHTPRKRSGR